MTEFVQKSVQSSVFKTAGPMDLKTVSSNAWTGEITAKFTGEFPSQSHADAFITQMTEALNRVTQPSQERFVDRVNREASHNDVVSTFNLNTTSPTPPDWR